MASMLVTDANDSSKSIPTSCWNPSTTMGDENPIHTLGDYSKPYHRAIEYYHRAPTRNKWYLIIDLTIKGQLNEIGSITVYKCEERGIHSIRLVQNGCSFHGLQFEDPNQHLKDFLKLVDSLDLDGENRERMRLCLFQFSLRDQASNWLERLPAGSITTWEDLTT
ncbi:hypothetical protein Tco_0927417 [Tanacetum coccineum]